MKIYNYDKESKEFLCEGFAQKNPLRNGEFLFPPFSTTIKPPSVNSNETIIFDNDCWKIISDFRGQKQINLLTMEISVVDKIGNLDDNWILYSVFKKSAEYKNYAKKMKSIEDKNMILSKLEELDAKRLRAICEPSVKDDATGQTWLEYYNEQIVNLRRKLSEVKYDY